MQVNCPNCGEKVTAENINIQKMTAVCAACDSVFSFDLPETKVKRRKVKQPAKVTLNDGDTLHMEFRTDFRLDRDQTFLTTSMMGSIMTFMALLIFVIAGTEVILMPILFLTMAAVMFYVTALTVFNKTHIAMDEDSIKVTRGPLPNPLVAEHEVLLAGVTAIKYEETAISKKEGYDTPRYVVWAQTEDGSRRTIVNDVIEEYAVFIAQRLEEHLHLDADLDVSRLEESGQHLEDEEDEVDTHEAVRASQNKAGS